MPLSSGACPMTWTRVICCLLLLLALLQMLQVSLFTQLDTSVLQHQRDHLNSVLQLQLQVFLKSLQEAFRTSAVMDTSGEYRVVQFLHTPLEVSTQSGVQVTLATHCSADNILPLIELHARWDGPISIAVFLPETDPRQFMVTIAQLLFCMPEIRRSTAIHLVYPLSPGSFDDSVPLNVKTLQPLVCDNITKTLELAKHRNNYMLDGIPYPNNLLRNVALRNAHSSHVFTIDVDMIPNAGLHTNLVNFLRNRGNHSANMNVYVVPVFEICSHISPPANKAALISLWRQRLARPFYYELCDKCQRQTQYGLWANASAGDLRVVYYTTWKDPWEPFYVGPAEIPHYDERFKQYGFNRISQVCELHIAGYKFGVLNDAFLVHRGYKTQENFHRSKELEQQRNRLLFRKFKEELKTKYPESERRCY